MGRYSEFYQCPRCEICGGEIFAGEEEPGYIVGTTPRDLGRAYLACPECLEGYIEEEDGEAV